MQFDIKDWIMNLFDGNIDIECVRVVCDEQNRLICGVAVDKNKNKVFLSKCNATIVISLIASKENIDCKSFLQLDSHPIVDFIKVKEKDLIKKISLTVIDDINNIYKMIIIDANGKRREIIDKKEQRNLINMFALQHAVSVSELENVGFNDFEITKTNEIITNIDIVVDEWKINDGPSVEKIIVTTMNGEKKEYSDIEDIRKVFISLCYQEYPCLDEARFHEKKIKKAYRSDFLDCVKGISIVNVVKPIYERIEIIERSHDFRMVPTKVRIVTINHGTQVYDLVNGALIFDSNYDNETGKNNLFGKIKKKLRKNNVVENGNVYTIEKRRALLFRYMDICEFELEKSFFVKYFAEQELAKKGITKEKVGQSRFLEELQKMQREIVTNARFSVSKVNYQKIEILEYIYDASGHKLINKINVITNNETFIVEGYKDCDAFIRKFATIKKLDFRTILNDSRYVVDLSENNKGNISEDAVNQSEEPKKSRFVFRNFFSKCIVNTLKKFKLTKKKVGNVKQKKFGK